MTAIDNLRRFMRPNYQDPSDEALLAAYITKYTYPECAASALWEELAGSYSATKPSIGEITTGAEKFKFYSPVTAQQSAMSTASMYAKRCDALNNNLGCAIRITKSPVAGIPGKPYV